MKVEVTQHAVRLIDVIETLQGRNERSYQFHHRRRIRMCERVFTLFDHFLKLLLADYFLFEYKRRDDNSLFFVSV